MASKHEFPIVEGSPSDYFALNVRDDDSGRPASITKEPIMFWVIAERNFVPRPMTSDGVVELDTPILRPDGTVAWEAERFPSADALLVYMQKSWDEQEAEERNLDNDWREGKQQRYEAFLKDNGISIGDQVAQPAVSLSPARAAINAALAATKAAAAKGGV